MSEGIFAYTQVSKLFINFIFILSDRYERNIGFCLEPNGGDLVVVSSKAQYIAQYIAQFT